MTALNTSIAYHGDCPSYPYRVVENGLWIASVASYSTGDNVLTGLALARIYVNVMERLAADPPDIVIAIEEAPDEECPD